MASSAPRERPDKTSEFSVFYSVKAPSVDLCGYVQRIMEYFYCSRECYAIASVYIDRIARLHAEFKINSLSVHRLLLASVLVATKFQDDNMFSMKWYADVGGVHVDDLARMELSLLKLLDWRMHVSQDEYTQHAQLLGAVAHRLWPERSEEKKEEDGAIAQAEGSSTKRARAEQQYCRLAQRTRPCGPERTAMARPRTRFVGSHTSVGYAPR